VLIAALACAGPAACGDDGNPPIDAPPDVAVGSCDGKVAITGEVVDWDANRTTFCGVFNATLTVRGTPALTDGTNPNGRFELCVPPGAVSLVDVAFSATPSECTTPKDSYPVAGVLVVDPGDAPSAQAISARAMTTARRATMFAQVGEAYDPAKAQLVVHVGSAARQVALSTAHAATQAFDGTAWAAGDAGVEVFFPNAAPGTTTVTLGSSTRTLTLAPGVFTYLSFLAPVPLRAR
jgi:hypothetical protein